MASMKSLEDLFLDKLKDVYDGERRITRALPKMARTASSEELSSAFEDHLRETEGHIERLERIFENLGKTPARKVCHAMVGLLEEGQTVMDEDGDDDVIDAGLIAAAQSVEHYEMAGYGSLRTWAQVLGRNQEAKLLQETLQEEEAADERLTQIASRINRQAREREEAVTTSTRKSGGSRSSERFRTR
jgi:ferritin-like metal-binding protein YciE